MKTLRKSNYKNSSFGMGHHGERKEFINHKQINGVTIKIIIILYNTTKSNNETKPI